MSLPDRLSTANKNPDRREENEEHRRGGEEEVVGGTAVSVYGSFGCHALLNSRGRRGPFKRSERIVLLHGKVRGSRAGWRDLGRRFRIALKPTPMHQRSGRRAFRHIHNRLGAAGFDSLRVRHGDRRACPPDRRRILDRVRDSQRVGTCLYASHCLRCALAVRSRRIRCRIPCARLFRDSSGRRRRRLEEEDQGHLNANSG